MLEDIGKFVQRNFKFPLCHIKEKSGKKTPDSMGIKTSYFKKHINKNQQANAISVHESSPHHP